MNNLTSNINDKDQARAFWLTHIKQWQESNLSQPAYCKQSGIKYNSFVYWRNLLNKQLLQPFEEKFVPLKIVSNKPAATETQRPIQIKLLTGHIVYIPSDLDVKAIVALIHQLGMPNA